MSGKIGDITIPAITDVSVTKGTDNETYEQINDHHILVRYESGLQEIEIEGVLMKQNHPQELPVDEQREQVETLVDRDAKENFFDYLDWRGHLSVESIDASRAGDEITIRPIKINATYMPFPDYYPDSSAAKETLEGDN